MLGRTSMIIWLKGYYIMEYVIWGTLKLILLPTTAWWNLRAMFDSNFTMVSHVNSVVKKASFHLRNIGKVRKLLTTKKVMQSLVIYRIIDYCNALASGIQEDTMTKLQRLQHHAARIVNRTKRHKHISPVTDHLHSFPMKFKIDFKILLIEFKA